MRERTRYGIRGVRSVSECENDWWPASLCWLSEPVVRDRRKCRLNVKIKIRSLDGNEAFVAYPHRRGHPWSPFCVSGSTRRVSHYTRLHQWQTPVFTRIYTPGITRVMWALRNILPNCGIAHVFAEHSSQNICSHTRIKIIHVRWRGMQTSTNFGKYGSMVLLPCMNQYVDRIQMCVRVRVSAFVERLCACKHSTLSNNPQNRRWEGCSYSLS